MHYFDVSKLKSVENKIRSVLKFVQIRDFFLILKIRKKRILELLRAAIPDLNDVSLVSKNDDALAAVEFVSRTRVSLSGIRPV